MTPEKAQELFSEYREGTLDPGLRQALERHFYENPATQEEYRVFVSVYDSLSNPSEVTPPQDLSEIISRRLDLADWERKREPKRQLKWFRLLTMGATAAVVIMTGYITLDRFGPQSGIAASSVPGVSMRTSSPSVIRSNGETRIRFWSNDPTVVTVHEGGTKFETLPPSDATLLRSDELRGEYNVPLAVNTTSPTYVWVTVKGLKGTTAIFLPGSPNPSITSTPEGNIVNALQSLSAKYGVVIEARLNQFYRVHAVTFDNRTIGAVLDDLLTSTGLSWKLDGDLVRIR
jgi:hypothetical protein